MFQLFPAITKAHGRNYGQIQTADAAHRLRSNTPPMRRTATSAYRANSYSCLFLTRRRALEAFGPEGRAKSIRSCSRLSTELLSTASCKPHGQRYLRIRAGRSSGRIGQVREGGDQGSWVPFLAATRPPEIPPGPQYPLLSHRRALETFGHIGRLREVLPTLALRHGAPFGREP
jgi:hypothetical protein